ncbi:hypothetical protein MBLNU230_g6735t1 [Neophaeotheca triangularis]
MDDKRDVFRVRLNCLDHYMSQPTSLDPPIFGNVGLSTQRILPQVPVVRVFGATETGQKVCAHIHGAFPYLYIPYTESIEPETVRRYIRDVRSSIDHALALSYRRNPYDNPRNSTFVAHVSLCKGVPFFGYNVGYAYYLKVYLLNPQHMTRFADLLHQGAILQRVFQPYEAHQQYLLQWMCDFNMYGCAYVETRRPHFRFPVPTWEELDDLAHLWHDRSIDSQQILDETQGYPRQSHCTLEIDIRVEDILNRHEISPRPLHHSFIERLASLENLPPEEKLVHSMAGLWKDETRRRKLRQGITDPSSSPFPPEVLVSMSADPRNADKGGWIHEDEFRNMVEELSKQEKSARGGQGISFESFRARGAAKEEDGVQTVFESIEELFQDRMMARLKSRSGEGNDDGSADGVIGLDSGDGNDKEQEQPLVDESSIRQAVDDEEYGSDEDEAKFRALTQREKLADAGLDGAVGDGKVNGSTGSIEKQAETLDPESVPAETVDAVERNKRGAESAQGEELQAKRAKAEATFERPQSRHVAFRVQDIKPEKPRAVPAKQNFPLPAPELALPPSGQAAASSQRSSQGSQNSKLGFPSVKNNIDPDTGLRLSQKEYASDTTDEPNKSLSQSLSTNDSQRAKSAFSGSTAGSPEKRTPRAIDEQVTRHYASTFNLSSEKDVLIFNSKPPSSAEVETTVSPPVLYQNAYYSNEKDVPERPREYAGQEFILQSTTLPYLSTFDSTGDTTTTSKAVVRDRAKEALQDSRRRRQCKLRSWEILKSPPTFCEVAAWMKSEAPPPRDELDDLEIDAAPAATPASIKRKNRPAAELSQIDGPTQKNKHGFKYSQKKSSTSVQHETGYMSTMSLEVHVNSRADLAPDPEHDEIALVFWCLSDEQADDAVQNGILVLNNAEGQTERIRKAIGGDVKVEEEDDELDLINKMVDIVRELDPDILTGYEVHNASWGYLIERARLKYEFNLPDEFSRMKSQSHGRFGKDADRWGFTHTSTVSITGRHTINIWRAMRSELNLLQYTMENVAFHLLHRRIPHYSPATLTRWYRSGTPRHLAKVLDYHLSRTQLDLEILSANELIPRTSEQARLLGVDFFSVFSRGSQFKVESLMFRIAKPESFVLVSPSRKQVGSQNALECLPLVMEPQSDFYSSPVLVLDFQSLYPSVMIAYNYCYSTCLGRIVNWRGTNKLGFADFQRSPGLLELVKDHLNIAPNGMMYVKPSMRKSLLAKMLGEILETRVMVKSGMKVDKDDKTLQQLLNNRQLALKLIANVTYGYTSASFSGRMPCSEIADSIVQTGRETLEKAIALIHSVERWGAEVVYGDTDSLFIHLPNRSRAQAFAIGEEISSAVTATNPRPVKLKFEKVYHPCVLLAKKRYVGFKYESPSQTEPDFDAKGIETVRRDGTPAEQKIEEKALKLLFRTADLSQVKAYFQAQCTKILTGRYSVQDFCFAKEVKLGTYADRGPPPPGALIATKRMLRDPRLEPQYGERVPYVVIAGGPGARLFERCVEPEVLLGDAGKELDAEYYINKNLIPPLERIFNLVGANVRGWWEDMPKVVRIRQIAGGGGGDEGVGGIKGKRKTMESYMGSSLCLVCRARVPALTRGEQIQLRQEGGVALPLCKGCREQRTQRTLLALRRKVGKAEERFGNLEAVCRSCAGLAFGEEVKCDSRDCPVFYSRVKAGTALGAVRNGVGRVVSVLEELEARREDLEW